MKSIAGAILILAAAVLVAGDPGHTLESLAAIIFLVGVGYLIADFYSSKNEKKHG